MTLQTLLSFFHYFSVAKLRHYFESCIDCLWKRCKQEKNGNSLKSADYEKSGFIPYGKLLVIVWKRGPHYDFAPQAGNNCFLGRKHLLSAWGAKIQQLEL
jgi:hypothetical protein